MGLLGSSSLGNIFKKGLSKEGFLTGGGNFLQGPMEKFGDMYTAGDWHDQYSAQKQFAQHGIRWKVEDAIKAGLHPLAALGVQTASFSPVSVGNPVSDITNMASMGQNLFSSLTSGASAEEKEIQLLDIAQKKEKLNQMQLETQGMQKQLNEMNASPGVQYDNRSQLDKNYGIVGQGKGQVRAIDPDTGQELPIYGMGHDYQKRKLPYSDTQGIASGVQPLEQYAVDQSGRLHKMPEKDIAEIMESDFFTQIKYAASRGSQWAQNIWGYLKRNDPAGAEPYHKWIRDHRPASPQVGTEYRYDPVSDTWVLNEIDPEEGSRLYHGDWNKTRSWDYVVRGKLPRD